ncbi:MULTISPECIES: phosphotransferase [unclassified Pseudonocardia]|uniref:phosphotransferase enzyme family protein n=1 Tax=unclassified Pseudonocardia TaxID=2619320 RepID=UPI00095F580C|nr:MULTISPECIES: phosphotransferase [unclassified Pseudonocardia]MBN9100897.1 phosphotransferase [Pseudonocardia sp.]OJY51600.1 MAG: aminoglycoside phosphotransferase [Pseudonocardia sp. 73-21]
MTASEVPLLGGTANRGRVHRVGDTVRRPMRPTSAATHALLRHLEDVGFDGAPRVLGIDDAGREVLTYMPGDAVTVPLPDWGLTDDALRSTGELLRRFHDAVAGFDPAPHTWSHPTPAAFRGGGIAHNDPNLDNVVFRDGRAVALIDFDLAAPGSPVWDLATAARLWAPLRSPSDVSDVRRGRGLERLRILVDAYGLDEQGRELLVTALREAHDWMVTIVAEGARDGVPGFAAYWTPDAAERARRTDAWMEHNTDAIRAVLAT